MRALAVAALIAGALIRFAILPISVPEVDNPWRAWSYHAATRGPWSLYGPRGHTVAFADLHEAVVYPPLALDELALVGRAHLALTGGRFENDVALTRTIKGAIVLLDAVLAALIFVVVRRVAGSRRGWWAALAYWLNPAVLLTTALGFFDVFLAIPAVGAVAAASYGRPWLSGILFTAAVMTKPQGLLVAPALALALWNDRDGRERWRSLAEAAAASAMTAALLVLPLVVAGTAVNMLRSVAVLAGHDALSALAFNAWWIVGYLMAAAKAAPQGWLAALRAPAEMFTHADALARGFPHPRLIALAILPIPIAWAFYTRRRARDLGLHAALAAFVVVTYFTLSVQVHENHFFLAIPLLAVAAALRPSLVPVFAALSVTFALNLYMVYGTGVAPPAEWLTTMAGLDVTVLIAFVECALFARLAIILGRTTDARPNS
jgi:hypothetical protein